MGAVLLSGGEKKKRFCLSNSRVMIHQPLGSFQGQATDFDIQAKEILSIRSKTQSNTIQKYWTNNKKNPVRYRKRQFHATGRSKKIWFN